MIRRKFRGAILAVIAANRLRNLKVRTFGFRLEPIINRSQALKKRVDEDKNLARAVKYLSISKPSLLD
jgi:hypothetical protein